MKGVEGSQLGRQCVSSILRSARLHSFCWFASPGPHQLRNFCVDGTFASIHGFLPSTSSHSPLSFLDCFVSSKVVEETIEERQRNKEKPTQAAKTTHRIPVKAACQRMGFRVFETFSSCTHALGLDTMAGES